MKHRLVITSTAAALAFGAGGCGADEAAEPARAAPTATPASQSMPAGTLRGSKPGGRDRKKVATKRAKPNTHQAASKKAPAATSPPPPVATPMSRPNLPSATSRGAKEESGKDTGPMLSTD